MSLLETLHTKLTEARKARNKLQMDALQVILGDASMIDARTGKKATDEEIDKIIRKLVVGNTETLDLLKEKGMTSNPDYARRTEENAYLATLLPRSMSVDEIKSALAEVADTIKGAKNDGQATGVAMKHLKSKNLKVQGDDVSAAVKQLRQ
jgi:uncharacterized protein YqeY